MSAVFNEIEPYAAQWLGNLIAAGHLAPGAVDARSIKELTPADVAGFTQAHFVAGIGVWSHALRAAGWDDARPVWTGSCPCQPFSASGRRAGKSDPRHLWPDWFRLIRECRPPIVLGEQVASKDGLAWLDDVLADLEGAGYAAAAFDLCAAGFGAPHIRQRLYFAAVRVADAAEVGRRWGTVEQGGFGDGENAGRSQSERLAEPRSEARGLAHHHHHGREELAASRVGAGQSLGHDADGRGAPRGLADAAGERLDGRRSGEARDGRDAARVEPQRLRDARGLGHADCHGARWDTGAGTRAEEARGGSGRAAGRVGDVPRSPGPTGGFWSAADWLPCRDGKWRPVEPGTFPLAHGAPARVGRLRAYGNAIVAPQAVTFIEAVMDALGGTQ